MLNTLHRFTTCGKHTVGVPRSDAEGICSARIRSLAPTTGMEVLVMMMWADPVKEFCSTHRPAWQTACLFIWLPVIEPWIQIIARVRNVSFTVALCRWKRMLLSFWVTCCHIENLGFKWANYDNGPSIKLVVVVAAGVVGAVVVVVGSGRTWPWQPFSSSLT